LIKIAISDSATDQVRYFNNFGSNISYDVNNKMDPRYAAGIL
jgi:hypothetical protein